MTNKGFSFDAVIFDLDGVITMTALAHSRAWTKMFNEYLMQREQLHDEKFREFSHENDYLKYVDGKPRYDGVRSFLDSRGIHIPFGDPSDDGSIETVCGLGNRKNAAFNEVLASEGVKVYESTVALMKNLREAGIRVGVASSSKNCRPVLETAGLLSLVETIVDGVVSAELKLKGKPAPDIFISACHNLGTRPSRAVVVEDATSGVAAGKAGNFGLVVGIAREENVHELLVSGADFVVPDMVDCPIERIESWFNEGLQDDNWSITYHSYEPAKERTREALLAVGNGYFGTRGAMEEADSNAVNYPGTYLAGLYNRLITRVSDQDVENEDFVNAPNWLCLSFRIGGDDWININKCIIISVSRRLDFRNGLLSRVVVIRDEKGQETSITSTRMASMANPHLAALRYTITPLNYSGKITFRSGLNGNIINENVERYKSLDQRHLKAENAFAGDNQIGLLVSTTQSGILIAEVADHHFCCDDKDLDIRMSHDIANAAVYGMAEVDAMPGSAYTIEKKVAIYTSKVDDVSDPMAQAQQALSGSGDYTTMLKDSGVAWSKIWQKIDIQIGGDRFSQKMMRMHLYHLLISMSPNNKTIDASITARGLHGEAYRGHIFWDEIFIMPIYDMNLPEVAKSMLMYRYRRLDEARKYAKSKGYCGAMFPWQSGSDGREETQVIHLNPLSGNWDTDHSSLQRHVSLAIAFNVWQYIHTTNDLEFLKEYGAELFFEICRFWASKCVFNEKTKRFDLPKVMGPDEFHEQYEGAAEGGLNNNAYTNIMVTWMFNKANEIIDLLKDDNGVVFKKIGLNDQEFEEWNRISKNLTLCINDDGIIAQYDGYFDLKELDWQYYKNKYGDIYRMDRILKSEGKSPDAFKVAKQADMLMAFYNLDRTEVDHLLEQLGYQIPDDYLQLNLEFYFQRTSHGSTLSRIVHARLASLAGNAKMSWTLYSDALASDFNDIQGGTTAEGIHAGVMGGTVLIAISTYAGININGDRLHLNPALPDAWTDISCSLEFRGTRYQLFIGKECIKIHTSNDADVIVNDKLINVRAKVQSVINN